MALPVKCVITLAEELARLLAQAGSLDAASEASALADGEHVGYYVMALRNFLAYPFSNQSAVCWTLALRLQAHRRTSPLWKICASGGNQEPQGCAF